MQSAVPGNLLSRASAFCPVQAERHEAAAELLEGQGSRDTHGFWRKLMLPGGSGPHPQAEDGNKTSAPGGSQVLDTLLQSKEGATTPG